MLRNRFNETDALRFILRRKPICGLVRLLLKRKTRVRFLSGWTKDYKNWYPKLPCLTFSDNKVQCEAFVFGPQLGRWLLDSKTPKVPSGQGNSVNKAVIIAITTSFPFRSVTIILDVGMKFLVIVFKK